MRFRILTDEERTQINKAKQAANHQIRNKRAELRERIKKLEKQGIRYGLNTLTYELESLHDVTGWPVILALQDNTILLNYQLLLELQKSIHRSHYQLQKVEIAKIQGRTILLITHDAGFIELYEHPEWQRNLLSDLPIIQIDLSK